MIEVPYWNASPKKAKDGDNKTQEAYNLIAEFCKSSGATAKNEFIDRRNYETCEIYKTANELNPQFVEIMKLRDERNDLHGTGKVQDYEDRVKKFAPKYTFCDGFWHYKSSGTDPYHIVICYCPVYENYIRKERGDVV